MSETLRTIGLYTVMSELSDDCPDHRNGWCFVGLCAIGALFLVPFTLLKDLGIVSEILFGISMLSFASSIIIPDYAYPHGCGVRIYTLKFCGGTVNEDEYKFTSDSEGDKQNINRIVESHVDEINTMIAVDAERENKKAKCESGYQERISDARINQ